MSDKYYQFREVVQKKNTSKSPLPQSYSRSDQKHSKALSYTKTTNTSNPFVNAEFELSDDSFSKYEALNGVRVGMVRDTTPTKMNQISRPNNMEMQKTEETHNKSLQQANMINNYQVNPGYGRISDNSVNMGNVSVNKITPTSASHTRNNSINMPVNPQSSATALCPNCQMFDSQQITIKLILNHICNELNELSEIENLWRNGKISFENDQIGSNFRQEVNPTNVYGLSDKNFYKNDLGRGFLEVQKKLWSVKIKFEDLILDVENLSKTNPFTDVELENKENLNPAADNGTASAKLLDCIQDAKECIEIMRGNILKDTITEAMLKEINDASNKKMDNFDLIKTLKVQLEQSKRDRRLLQVEMEYLRNQLTNNLNTKSKLPIDMKDLREKIREILEQELKKKKAALDVSGNSSFNFNY